MRKLILSAAILSSALVGVAADAAVSMTSSPLNLALPAGTGAAIDFESGDPAGFTISKSNAAILNTTDGNGAEPAGGNSYYLSVMGNGYYSLLGTTAYTNVSLYWGSIDNYNNLDLLDLNGATIASINGSSIPSVANGNQSAGATNMRVNVFSDTAFYGLKFRSDANSFEADNIRFQAAVPEPASWAMFIGGFGLIGSGMRRRRLNVSFA